MGGFLKKLNPFDDDDDKKKKEEDERRAADEVQRAQHEAQRAADEVQRAQHEAQRTADEARRAEEERQRAADQAATAVLTSEGTVTGSSLGRKYTTKAGDRLEALAAYFYGASVHKQRLIDDNPALKTWDRRALPAGLTINVGEDPTRGDAIPTA
jgi:hypothetical protein